MPSYHIWIRKEDEAKWKAIENKPEWLHKALNGLDTLREDLKSIPIGDLDKVHVIQSVHRIIPTDGDGVFDREPTITPAEETL